MMIHSKGKTLKNSSSNLNSPQLLLLELIFQSFQVSISKLSSWPQSYLLSSSSLDVMCSCFTQIKYLKVIKQATKQNKALDLERLSLDLCDGFQSHFAFTSLEFMDENFYLFLDTFHLDYFSSYSHGQ